MPYAASYTDQNTLDPTLLSDGANRRRAAPPVRPKSSVAELLAQAALKGAGAGTQPTTVQPLPPVGDPTTTDAPAVELTPPPGTGQQRYGTGTLGGPNVDDRGIAHIGVASPAGRSPLGRKLDEYRARSEASPDSKVTETGWGYEEAPPSVHGPSRLRKGLEGFLTMGALAGANGPTEGTAGRFLGGGIAGGATGAIKPSLMQKFQRDVELGQLRDDIGADQSIEMKNAQIADEASKPELNSLRIQNTLNEALLRERDREADNKRADVAQTIAAGSATERARHDKAMEDKPPKPAAKRNPISLGGQFWEEDAEGVMRVKKGSPPPTPSAASDRATVRGEKKTASAKEAASLYQKGSEYWDQAKAKRAKAATISGKEFQSDAEKARLAVLNREAEGLEAKTREVQLEGDRRAAESEGADEPAGNKLTEQQVRDAAVKAHLDPNKAVERARAKGRL